MLAMIFMDLLVSLRAVDIRAACAGCGYWSQERRAMTGLVGHWRCGTASAWMVNDSKEDAAARCFQASGLSNASSRVAHRFNTTGLVTFTMANTLSSTAQACLRELGVAHTLLREGTMRATACSHAARRHADRHNARTVLLATPTWCLFRPQLDHPTLHGTCQ